MKKIARYILTSDFWKMRFCAVKKNHAKSKLDFFTIITASQLTLYNTKNYSSYPKIKEQLNRSMAAYFGLFLIVPSCIVILLTEPIPNIQKEK